MLCIFRLSNVKIDPFKSHLQLKELHLEQTRVDDEMVEKIGTTLPNFNLAALKKLENPSVGMTNKSIYKTIAQDVRALVRAMPSLQRMALWNNYDAFPYDYLNLFKAWRDNIRASGLDRQLWMDQNDVLCFSLNSDV